jgi:hypothetical protein
MWRCVMPTTWWDELREIVWLASVVGGLSALGVILGVAIAVLGEWQHVPAVVGHV